MTTQNYGNQPGDLMKVPATQSIRVAELKGMRLDWWVAKAEGHEPEQFSKDGHGWVRCKGDLTPYSPSTQWGQGGPIIDRLDITVGPHDTSPAIAHANVHRGWNNRWIGPTKLVAAMRCRVAMAYGDEVPE